MTLSAANGCVHHWVVEPPSGGHTSTGKCKRCAAKREFPNSAEYMAWTAFNRKAAARGTANSAKSKAKKSRLTVFWHGDTAKQAGVQPDDDDEDPF